MTEAVLVTEMEAVERVETEEAAPKVGTLRGFAWPEGRRGRRLQCLLCGRSFVSTGKNRRRCSWCNRRISAGVLGDQEILLDRNGRVGPRERAD